MDNLGTEIARFFAQYQTALAALANIHETLRTDDANVLKVTLIESGILERGVERERRAMLMEESRKIVKGVEKEEGKDTMTRTSLTTTAKEAATATPALGSVSRLQSAVEMLLATNGNGNNSSTALVSSASTSSPATFNASSGNNHHHIPMMSIEQRSIVRLKLQFLFDDLGKAVNRLRKAADPSEDDAAANRFQDADDDEAEEEDDYQILRHHIFPDDAATNSGKKVSEKGAAAAADSAAFGYGDGQRKRTSSATVFSPKTTFSSSSSSSLVPSSTKLNTNNSTKTSKGPFKSLQDKAMLPTHIEDLRVLCEDLHEKAFLANQKLRMSDAQREELLFRLNAREETIRGLRAHFLRELVHTIGTSSSNSNSGNNKNTLNNPARFAGIPVTFIEEKDIEVARRIATAQLELEQIRSDHGKELWRQREGWAKRLEAKEKEIIQLQIMFRNALASLQGKHASTVSKIVDENATLKQNNVHVEQLALQRAEAFFEMKLNERIAQLTSQYEAKLSVLGDKLTAANEAFKQSLRELKSERKHNRKLNRQLQDAERALDHALLIELPHEGARSARNVATELESLAKSNELLLSQIAALELERGNLLENHQLELKDLKESNVQLTEKLKALEFRLNELQQENGLLRSNNHRLRGDMESRESTIRALQNEIATYRDKFLSMQSPNFYLDQNFKFGDDDEDDENDEKTDAGKLRKALKMLEITTKRAITAEEALISATASEKELRDEVDRLRSKIQQLEEDAEEENAKKDAKTADEQREQAETNQQHQQKRSSSASLQQQQQQLLDRERKRFEDTENKLRREKADLEQQLKALQEQLGIVQERYNAANGKCDEYRSHIAELDAIILQLESQINNNNAADGHNNSSLLNPSNKTLSGRSINTATTAGGGGAGGMSRVGSASSLLFGGRRSATPQPPMVSVGTDSASLLNLTKEQWEKLVGKGSLAFNDDDDAATKKNMSEPDVNKSKVNDDNKNASSSFFGDVPSSAQHLIKERQLNANLRRRLADLNAQVRIASREQEWPIGFGAAAVSTTPTTTAATDVNVKTDSEGHQTRAGSGTTTIANKIEAYAGRPASRLDNSSSENSEQNKNSKKNGDTQTQEADLSHQHHHGDDDHHRLIEMLPIPLTNAHDIEAQNTLFQKEIAKRMVLLGTLSEQLVVEAEEDWLKIGGGGDLQYREDTADYDPAAGDSRRGAGGGAYLFHRPGKNVRYSLNAMPLPNSRLSNTNSDFGSAAATPLPFNYNRPSSAKFGAGFTISHRPQSGPINPRRHSYDHLHRDSNGSSIRKGKAPTLEAYTEDMGVYEDDEEEDDGRNIVEAHFIEKRNHTNANSNRSTTAGLVGNDNKDDDDEGDDDKANLLYYDANGLPRYVYGFIPKKFQKLQEDEKEEALRSGSAAASGRTTGGAVKGRLTPRAPLAPSRPSTAGPTIPSSPSSSSAAAAAAAAPSHRYIQPQSFFTIRSRLLNGIPEQQKWEMSSAQIRRAASRGLMRGGQHTTALSSAASAAFHSNPDRTDSPRYRPLPGEESNQQNNKSTNLDNNNYSSGYIRSSSLSRPLTAGPVRAPTVLEVSSSNRSGR